MQTPSFRESLQRGRIIQPPSARFSPRQWTKDYERSPRSEDDLALHAAGLWFHSRLSQLRDLAKQDEVSGLSKEEQCRVLVGCLNALAITLTKFSLAKLDSPEQPVNMTAFQQHLVQAGFNMVGPQDLIESLVEGLRFPLAGALATSDVVRAPPPADLTSRTLGQLAVGSAYNYLVEAWAQVVFDNWKVVEAHDADLVQPGPGSREVERVVAAHRRESLNIELALWSVRHYRFQGGAQRFPEYVRAVVHVRKRKGRLEIKIGNVPRSDSEPSDAVFHRVMGGEPELAALKSQPLPILPTLKLSDIENVRDLLVSFGNAILPKSATIPPRSIADFNALAPLVPIRDLRIAVTQALSFDAKEASLLLDFFMWKNDVTRDIWTAPLIKVNDTEVLVLLPALMSANPLYCIESWLRQAGIDLSLRGPAFEQAAREALADAIKSCKRITNCGIFPRAFDIPGEREAGDIDILVWLEDCLLVIEAKCNVRPDKALHRADVWSDYEVAASQLNKKVSAMRRQGRAVAERLISHGFKGSDSFSIVPCILSNLELGVGSLVGGIPVADTHVITRYFSPGHTVEEGLFNAAGRLPDSRSPSYFYSSPSEAVARLGQYLADPPHVRSRRNAVVATTSTAAVLGKPNFKPLKYEVLRVELPITSMAR